LADGATPPLSVVIATFARPEQLRPTLASLAACDPRPAEVIVVDGDPQRSAAPVVDEARADLPELAYIASTPGLTHQRNRGIDSAKGDVIVFLDDDVVIAPDAFAHVAAAYRDPSVRGVAGRVDEPRDARLGGSRSRLRRLLLAGGSEGTFTRFGYPRRLVDRDTARDVEFMPGCFMSVRREDARGLRFDEGLEGYALAEDEDFSRRLSLRGRIRYEPAASVVHHNTGFAKRDRRAFGRQVVTNRHYLFKKNFPQTPVARAQFALLVGALLGHRLLNRDVAGALGIVDGIRAIWRGRR
jgi:GT2 family glycosyltransferase